MILGDAGEAFFIREERVSKNGSPNKAIENLSKMESAKAVLD